jgi:hypothetical protein
MLLSVRFFFKTLIISVTIANLLSTLHTQLAPMCCRNSFIIACCYCCQSVVYIPHLPDTSVVSQDIETRLPVSGFDVSVLELNEEQKLHEIAFLKEELNA